MRKLIVLMALLAIVTVFACERAPKIKGEEVTYSSAGVTMKGYIAYDENIKGKRPGVLVVHEWWGVNEYVRRRARMLAELGYTAFALDMYGEGKVADHPDTAGKFATEVMKNFPAAKGRFLAAMDLLKKHPAVDPERIAAIGYCFGGGVVLNMARQGADLRGVVSFHGALDAVTPAKEGMVKARILVLTGGDDKFVPATKVEAFKKEMNAVKADFRIVSYPGAMHAFTNPDATDVGKKFNIPIAYDPKADKESWEEMKKFLEEQLGK